MDEVPTGLRALDRGPVPIPPAPGSMSTAVSRGGWPDWIEQWRPLVVEYFPPEDVELAMAVIACESSGDSKAVNPKSGATGLFQHLPGYWSVRSYYAGVPGASIRNPEASTAVAVWLAYNTPNSWNHWSCARHMDW